jgi:hypothetical protein
MTRTLILYYSRTGTTAAVADELAGLLSADVEQIQELKDRRGPIGFVVACLDALRKRPSPIAPLARDPHCYQLLIFGTPVWSYTLAPAVRTALEQCRRAGADVAFFCTMGSSGHRRTFVDMQALAGRPPLATLALTQKHIRKGAHAAALADFAARLKSAL